MAKTVGKTGRITIGANTLQVEGWEVNEDPRTVEVNETNDNGTVQRISGLHDLTGSFVVHIDPATWATVKADLVRGAIVTMTLLYETGLTAFGPLSAIIGQKRITNNVGEPLKANVDFQLAGGPIDPA